MFNQHGQVRVDRVVAQSRQQGRGGVGQNISNDGITLGELQMATQLLRELIVGLPEEVFMVSPILELSAHFFHPMWIGYYGGEKACTLCVVSLFCMGAYTYIRSCYPVNQ